MMFRKSGGGSVASHGPIASWSGEAKNRAEYPGGWPSCLEYVSLVTCS